MRCALLRCAVCALVLGAAPPLAAAQAGSARYAPAQLRVADAELARAGEAMARGDHALAWQFADQAEFDARLAWSMSEDRWLRQDIAELGAKIALLKRRLSAKTLAGR
jgi:hypothetical protein